MLLLQVVVVVVSMCCVAVAPIAFVLLIILSILTTPEYFAPRHLFGISPRLICPVNPPGASDVVKVSLVDKQCSNRLID